MPYIKDGIRELFEKDPRLGAATVGDLNYQITRLCVNYLPKSPTYKDFNDIIGVLESAKLEFYRRATVPYENQKCLENGDVYYS